jgi:hypothetical protein
MAAAASAPPAGFRPAARIGPAYRGLPAPIRVALWVVVPIVLGFVLGATGPAALRRLGAVAALQPEILAWYSVRVLGFLAYLTVAGSVLYGLLLSTKILDAIAHRPVSFALHKDLAIVGLVLSMLHAGLLLADRSFAFSLRTLLVPFESPFAATWVGIGQLTFYALAVVTASFYVRRQIGQRAWRMLHYLTFLAFAGATLHGIAAGTDTNSGWAFWVYMLPCAAAVFLLTYRIVISMAAHLPGRHAEPAPRPVGPSPLAPRPLAPMGVQPAANEPSPGQGGNRLAGPTFD